MSKEQIVEKYQKDKESIESNKRLSQVEKDIAIYRRWRNYINEPGIAVTYVKQEPATIILTHKEST